MSEHRLEGGIEVLPILEHATVTRVGQLKDLGLGNPNGVPTDLHTEAAQVEFGEKLLSCLSEVTDTAHLGCIDGRKTLHNKDGSPAQVRHRQAGGTEILFGMAAAGEASIMETIPVTAAPLEVVDVVQHHIANTEGILPSAHLGGCGKANGEIADLKLMAENPAIAKGVEAIIGLPVVQEFTGTTYDPVLMERIQRKSAVLADTLEARAWDGQAFVEKVAAEQPAGVEVLQDDPADHAFHGHKERALVIVVSETMSIDEVKLAEHGLGDVFVMSLKPSRDIAKALAGNRGTEGYTQAFMANLAEHLAVANRLPSDQTPVYLIAA